MHESKAKRVGFFAEMAWNAPPPSAAQAVTCHLGSHLAELFSEKQAFWEAGGCSYCLREKYVGMDRAGDNWPECASYNLAEAHL